MNLKTTIGEYNKKRKMQPRSILSCNRFIEATSAERRKRPSTSREYSRKKEMRSVTIGGMSQSG